MPVITKPGYPDPNVRPRHARCGTCDCEFTFLPDERRFSHVTGTDKDGFPEDHYVAYVACPQEGCTNKVSVEPHTKYFRGSLPCEPDPD